ncbi:MAG TPA: proton-conducting transporter membrane subunit [Streptosporangiaceae bacterium]|jgi:hydrogenase-4 component F
MIGVILALLAVPLAAGLLSFVVPARVGSGITVTAGIASFGLVLALIPSAAHGTLSYLSYLRVDALSGVFLLATSFLYGAVSIYAAGYLKHRPDQYTRRFYLGFNVFAWAMLAAPVMGNLALLWIAVELTTIVSALLVALEGTDGAAEAAWKYVLIASAGLGLALLATIFAYYAGAQVLGEHYNLGLQALLDAGTRLSPTPVRLAFMLAVLGYGTKVGLVPVHTWLPDAHSEAPTPVSALLSGALLATSFYAILRFYQFTASALGSGFPRDTLLAFGIASLLLASLYLFGQRDVKRFLAYSSVEHMGILAIGVSFGAPVALAGVLLHVMAHAAAKGNAFMGAGVFTVKYGTKQMSAMRDGLAVLPWSGPLFLLAIFALSAFPPFGIFRSEFQIVAGGLASGNYAAAAILVVLVTVAFLGLATSATSMLLTPAPKEATKEQPRIAAARANGSETHGSATAVAVQASPQARPALERGEPSAWMVVPVLAGLAVLLLLGLHPPGELTTLIARGVAELRGTR